MDRAPIWTTKYPAGQPEGIILPVPNAHKLPHNRVSKKDSEKAAEVSPGESASADFATNATNATNASPVTAATAGVLAKKPLEQREPAVVISTAVGLGISLLALAGISLTQDQIDAFEIVIGVLLPILSTLAAGIATRSRVTPTAKLRAPSGPRT
jgi:hypothetical protein